jgi:hypothetical protein
MWRHGFTPQQVVKADVLDLVDTGLTRYQLVNSRNGTHIDRQAHQRIDNFLAAFGRSGGDGQQYLGDVVLGNQHFEFRG